jgi:hypothetical protein
MLRLREALDFSIRGPQNRYTKLAETKAKSADAAKSAAAQPLPPISQSKIPSTSPSSIPTTNASSSVSTPQSRPAQPTTFQSSSKSTPTPHPATSTDEIEDDAATQATLDALLGLPSVPETTSTSGVSANAVSPPLQGLKLDNPRMTQHSSVLFFLELVQRSSNDILTSIHACTCRDL